MNEIMVNGSVAIATLKNDKLVKACQRIEKASDNARTALFRIAYELRRIDANKLYSDDGFKSTAEFAEKVFGYKKAMTSNLTRIAERYMAATSPVCVLPAGVDGNGVAVGKEWTIGQLQEVLTLSTDEVQALVDNGTLNASMSAKAIRQAVKDFKAKRDGKDTADTAGTADTQALPPADDDNDTAADTAETVQPTKREKAFDAVRKALTVLLDSVDDTDAETVQQMIDLLEGMG